MNVKSGIMRLLKSDIFYYYVVKLIGVIISLAISLFVLKNISPSIYGDWTRINLLIALGTLFVSFGSRKYVYKIDGPLGLAVSKLNTQIIALSIILFVLVITFTSFLDLSTLLALIVILPFTAFYQVFQASAEKLSLTKTSLADILITVVLKSMLILALSFHPSLGVLVFIIPMAVSAFCKTVIFVRLSGLKFRFAPIQIPDKAQFHFALTNVSDWSFANAFRIVLVALLPMTQVGLIDRSTAFLRVPTSLVHEAAQRVLYTRKKFRDSNLYILINLLLLSLGACSVYMVFTLIDIGGENWTELSAYMLMLLPYIIIESSTNLFIPAMEMSALLIRLKTLFNILGIIVFVILYLYASPLKTIILVMTFLELMRLGLYGFSNYWEKKQRQESPNTKVEEF